MDPRVRAGPWSLRGQVPLMWIKVRPRGSAQRFGRAHGRAANIDCAGRAFLGLICVNAIVRNIVMFPGPQSEADVRALDLAGAIATKRLP